MLGEVCGRPPRLDSAIEKAVQGCCRDLIRRRLLHSAHDCSDGGLAVALAECCITASGSPIGAIVKLPEVSGARGDLSPFSEEPSRLVVSFVPAAESKIRGLVLAAGVPYLKLGTVGGDRLSFDGAGSLTIAALDRAWRSALTATLGVG
jgi:phosphoribosylformylglycinamidine synthase